MAGGDWCSPIRCSSALFDEIGARGERAAHRESDEGGRGVQEGSKGMGRQRRWLEREDKAWVRGNPSDGCFQNGELRVPTVVGKHDGTPGDVSDED